MAHPAPSSPQKHARGAVANPPNRFERLEMSLEPEEEAEGAGVRTIFLRDASRTVISYNDSPDISFSASLNVYRGCEHGCAYCYARPSHEYLGLSAGLDFESKIVVKEQAPELLRQELSARKWKPQTIAMSGITDCYQPIERRLELTRRCLAVLAEFRNPVGVITKNHLVTRDIDYLQELARHRAVSVALSITSLDPELAKVLEPRASPPSRRLAAIGELHQAGIPVYVMVAPVIPGLNDHEIPAILAAAAEAGAQGAGYVPLRLPYAVAPLFEEWLDRHAPGHKQKVLDRVRDLRGGRLNDPRFGSRMKGEGFWADQLKAIFTLAQRKAGIPDRVSDLSTAAFRVPSAQLDLFTP